ncbi:MAG TPA: hypothetical protein VEB43_21965 [Anaeromyxobacter sp.]|nr:hypothetical protein [Anaeromyxobacter sp.]
MKAFVRVWVAVALAAGPGGAARGNGGSSSFYLEGGVAGSLRPKQEATIELLSETLRIELDRQRTPAERLECASGGCGEGYVATARYRLRNRGKPARTLYAVPLVVPREAHADPDQPDPESREGSASVSAKLLARDVTISLAGAKHRCQFVPRPEVPWIAFPEDLPQVGVSLTEYDDHLRLAGYCAVELEIPRGVVELTLSYPGMLSGVEEHHPGWRRRASCAGSGPTRTSPAGAPAAAP